MRGSGATRDGAALRGLRPLDAATPMGGPAADGAEVPPPAAAPDPTALACGILMERHRIGPDRAAVLLAEVAGAHDVPSAVLADALVGLLTRPAPEAGPAVDDPQAEDVASSRGQGPGTVDAGPALEDPPRPPASALDSIVSAVASASEDGDAGAQLIADLTGASPDRAVIYAVGDDAALHLIGNMGTAADVAVAWQHLPLSLEIPLCASVTRADAIFLASPEELEAEFPATRGSLEGTAAWASVPILEGHLVVGVVGLSWVQPRAFDEATRARITRAVERTGSTLVRSLQGTDPGAGLIGELMHLLPDPWIVLGQAGGRQGGGFVIEAVAPTLDGAAWVGSPLAAVFPTLAEGGDLMVDLRQVRRSGAPLVRTVAVRHADGPPWEQRPSELRIVRSGRRIVLAWRPLSQPS